MRKKTRKKSSLLRKALSRQDQQALGGLSESGMGKKKKEEDLKQEP